MDRMNIPPSLQATLVAVTAMAAVTEDPWWVIGSTAVALHGAPVPVADVDLLLSASDARRILATAGVTAAQGRRSERFHSQVFGCIRGLPLDLEIMADLSVRTEGTWRPVVPATRELVVTGGAMLFVPAKAELQSLLRMIGRPKDLLRASLLDHAHARTN
jgi:hypothetical protein